MPQKNNSESIGLPARPFLYTLDQIGVLLNVSTEQVKQRYVHCEGRNVGVPRKSLMLARSIALPGDKPDWRVAERELIRWLKLKGYRYYERGVVTD